MKRFLVLHLLDNLPCRGATEGECARARIARSLWSRRLLPPLTQEPPKLDKLVSGNPAAVPLPLGGRLLVNANNVTVLNEISFVGEAFRLPFCKQAARTNKMVAHQIPPFIVGTGRPGNKLPHCPSWEKVTFVSKRTVEDACPYRGLNDFRLFVQSRKIVRTT